MCSISLARCTGFCVGNGCMDVDRLFGVAPVPHGGNQRPAEVHHPVPPPPPVPLGGERPAKVLARHPVIEQGQGGEDLTARGDCAPAETKQRTVAEEQASLKKHAGEFAEEIGSAMQAWHKKVGLLLSLFMLYGAIRQSAAICVFVGALLVFVFFGDLLYSRLLAKRVFHLSDDETTPAHEGAHADDPDFCATPVHILFGHHWTSITGAAPIIGPAIACYYGWLPALLWVVLGSPLAGAVHDFSVLVVSARNDARSIGDLAGMIISWRVRIIFLLLLTFLCWIVVAVFMNSIANLFIAYPETVLPVNMEIPLAALLGVSNRFVTRHFGGDAAKKVVLGQSIVLLVFLYALVFIGVSIERDFGAWEEGRNVDPIFGWALHEGKGTKYTVERELCRDAVNFAKAPDGSPKEATCVFGAKQAWTLYLTVYALVVSVIPVWVVLQPRDFINSHQLKFCMLLLVMGLLIKGPSIDAEAIRSHPSTAAMDSSPLFPMLFTTIACGAVSGFHGLVSSGVTSKQLDKMPDARVIGYCGMLGESTLSVLTIMVCCSSGLWALNYQDWNPGGWGAAFIPGAAALLEELGLRAVDAKAIVIVLVVSFAATTLDSGMRIQRVLIGELGRALEGAAPMLGAALQRLVVAGLLSAAPACLLANSTIVDSLWTLFGATNQLVACLSLLVVMVYVLQRPGASLACALPFLAPGVFLAVMIFWATGFTIKSYLSIEGEVDWFTTSPTYLSIAIAFVIALSVVVIFAEIVWYFLSGRFSADRDICRETGKIAAAEGGAPGEGFPRLEGLGCC